MLHTHTHTHIFLSITVTRVRQVSVERHLVNDALAYSPLVGNNTGVCSLTVRASASHQEGSCNLPGVCGPCVLRREKLVSYYHTILCITHTHTHTRVYTFLLPSAAILSVLITASGLQG